MYGIDGTIKVIKRIIVKNGIIKEIALNEFFKISLLVSNFNRKKEKNLVGR
jgi:ribosomal protein S21